MNEGMSPHVLAATSFLKEDPLKIPTSHHFGSLAVTASFLTCMGCLVPEIGEGSPGGSLPSDRGDVGLSSTSQAVVSPSQVIDARRSVAITDAAILSQFSRSEERRVGKE